MMYSQYLRIESLAGGVGCSNRAFIRAALSRLKKKARRKISLRGARHAYLKAGLEYLAQSRKCYFDVKRGML
jgi:hypothetical protein